MQQQINKVILTLLITMFYTTINAQKQKLGVISFSVPAGWQQQKFEGGIQVSFTDKNTGNYAIALITDATNSIAGATDNFKNEWDRLVKNAVVVNDEPAMQEPTSDNGWEIISGTANYTDGAQKGLATLLTATGGGQTLSVVLMTNTDAYQNELVAFINSLEFEKVSSTTVSGNTGNSSIVGLWIHYNTESSGTYNGFPQLTGGYMRREYLFNNDGTYLFRSKHWLLYTKDILFIYETGTYTINGNKLTITPTKGKGEFWGKVSNNTSAWGKLVKSSNDYKLEKTTYSFEFWPVSRQNETKLSLKTSKPTERDGSSGETNLHEFVYESWNKVSMIDNPPGFKTWVENKSVNSKSASATNKNAGIQNSNTASSTKGVTGHWIDYNAETSANPYNTNYAGTRNYTGGYRNKEYFFYPDGSYLYRKKYWVTTMTEILYTYESGTYTVNGNQLTLSPKKGKSEWWSKKGSDTKAWGKFIKAAEYKLEKTTYSFEIKYYSEGETTTIIINSTKPTERDGGQFNAPNEPFVFHYHLSEFESQIDNPPGFKTGFENKALKAKSTAYNSSSTNTNTSNKIAINSPVTGKIWESQTLEKFGTSSGNLSGFYSGGFWKYQYKFNGDGTYQFVYSAASGIANNPVHVLQYENGTYSVNGNRISVMPLKGTNEEWSVGKVNNGMSAEHIREVLEKRVKRLKSSTRKLEKITYPFSVEFWQGNNANALCLQHAQNTVREGSPGQSNQSCFLETASAKAENYNSLFK